MGRRRKRGPAASRAAVLANVTAARPAVLAASEPRGSYWRPIALSALLVAAVLIVYWQVRGFGLIELDDPYYVGQNVHVLTGLSQRNLAWCLAGIRDANWIPLSWISLMLDGQFYGTWPGGYHITNVLLHAANTILLFVFLRRATANLGRSAFVAGVFALHPLHVESVAWVAERKDVLSIFFGLISLWLYVESAKSGGYWRLAASFVCFVLSLLSKQTLVTLPFLMLLLDFWPLRRMDAAAGRRSYWRLVLEKLPFFAASAVFCGVAIFAQSRGHAVTPLVAVPLEQRLANAVVSYAAYLGSTLFPYRLAVYYPYPQGGIPWPVVAVASACLAAISVVACLQVRRRPYLFVGWFWFLGTLVPMIGIVQIGGQQRADRYMYFPQIGLALAVAWFVPAVAPALALGKRTLAGLAVIVLAALGATTSVQLRYWQDDVTLFRHALVSSPENAMAERALGRALAKQEHFDEGLEHLEAAVRLAPDSEESHYNLAVVLQNAGRLEEAAEQYREAIAIDDRHADAQNNLGVILCLQRRFIEAENHFRRGIAIDDEHEPSYVNLGRLCVQFGRYEEARQCARRALELDPNAVDAQELDRTLASMQR